VVNGADEIEVTLGNRKYNATAIAIDSGNDLAIVKISGSNLQTLPLGNSDRVQLAEDVRAVGFPLSAILGDGVKVTRGTISGIEKDAGVTKFQIDATINPGNSGGPLLDIQGNVIAINSAKLSGSPISHVGFSVPANLAANLLRANGISPAAQPQQTELSGPELARQAAPAVALITVRARAKATRLAKIQYRSQHAVQTTVNQIASTSGPEFERGSLTVDEYGRIRHHQELPDSLAQMLLVPLDPSGRQAWSYELRTQVAKPESKPRDPRVPAGFPASLRPKRGGSTLGSSASPPRMIAAIERHSFRILSEDGDTVRIQYTADLRTDDGSVPPSYHLHSTGEFGFDRGIGLVTTMNGRVSIVEHVDGQKSTIPLTISFRMKDPAEVEQQRRSAIAARERQAAQDQQTAADELAMDPARRAKYYFEKAVAGDHESLNKLAAMEPVAAEQRRIAAYLMREVQQNPLRTPIVMAAGQWATPRELTMFVKMLAGASERNWPVTRSIMRAIRHHKDQRTMEPLLRLLQGGHTVHRDAAESLIAMGPQAEDAVLELIDTDSRREVVKVLAKIGSQKSAHAIRQHITEFDTFGYRDAIQAIKEIEERN
jgi:hypothetical protein